MKSLKWIALIAALAWFGADIGLQKHAQSTVHVVETKIPNSSPTVIETKTGTPLEKSIHAVPDREFDSQEIQLLTETLSSVLNFAIQSKRQAAFQASEIDQPDRQQKARDILLSTYRLPLTRVQAQQKVYALQILALSQFTRREDCQAILHELATRFDQASDPMLRGVTGADFTAMVRLCQTIDPIMVSLLKEQRRDQASGRLIDAISPPSETL